MLLPSILTPSKAFKSTAEKDLLCFKGLILYDNVAFVRHYAVCKNMTFYH